MSGRTIVLSAVWIVAGIGMLLHQTTMQSSPRENADKEQIIQISASMFDFKPSEITLRKDVPVVFELTSKDHRHGFNLPEFHLRSDVMPGTVGRLRFTPDKLGTFTFFCDVFCGDRHEEMSGTIRVVE